MLARVIGLCVLTASAPAAAQSDAVTRFYPEQAYFDKVEAVVPVGEDGADADKAMRCTYYADMVLRQTQTNSPGFGPIFIMARPPGSARPACTAHMGLRETRLDVSGEGPSGRRGGFLFLTPTDGSGAEPFEIYRIRDRKLLYRDTRVPETMKSVEADGDTLRLTYVRAVDAPCSLPKDGVVCWAKTVKASHFVSAVASQPAPLKACLAAYRTAKEVSSDPSMVTYDVSLVIGPDGKANILSRGAIGCEPML